MEYLETRNIQIRQNKIYCPAHEERTPSCHIYEDSWFCFGCGAHGDVADLAKLFEGIEASELLEHWGGTSVMPVIKVKPKSTPEELTDAQIRSFAEHSSRLAANHSAIESIAVKRGWKPKTIHGLALDGDLGLTHDKRLTFHYKKGIKQRWKQAGERRISWLFGTAKEDVWRGTLLCCCSKAIITEGETDAITLIDLGHEIPGECIVVALSNSTTMPNPRQFIGKSVVIVPDNDAAGESSQKKLADMLQYYARTVSVFAWQ